MSIGLEGRIGDMALITEGDSLDSFELCDVSERMRSREGRVGRVDAPPVKYEAVPVTLPVRITYVLLSTRAFHLISTIFRCAAGGPSPTFSFTSNDVRRPCPPLEFCKTVSIHLMNRDIVGRTHFVLSIDVRLLDTSIPVPKSESAESWPTMSRKV
jgi:hypothetical protein